MKVRFFVFLRWMKHVINPSQWPWPIHSCHDSKLLIILSDVVGHILSDFDHITLTYHIRTWQFDVMIYVISRKMLAIRGIRHLKWLFLRVLMFGISADCPQNAKFCTRKHYQHVKICRPFTISAYKLAHAECSARSVPSVQIAGNVQTTPSFLKLRPPWQCNI